MSTSVSAAAIAEPIPNLVPGPSHSPNDRGPCLDIINDFGGNQYPFVRCQGRMIASYHAATDLFPGFPIWTCDTCGKKVIP